jgi:DNA polymerase V
MPRGGKRKGAGRPKGTGKFGTPTKAIRVPANMVNKIMRFIETKGGKYPLYDCQVQAGFPSPAEDNPPEMLDLNAHLVRNPSSTFFVRVAGESMTGAGIFPDDLLVVDRSKEPDQGDIVIAVVDGEFTVKRLAFSRGKMELRPENRRYRKIRVYDDIECDIWGVVRHVIHQV